MKNLLALLTICVLFFSCSDNENDSTTTNAKNGFTLNGVFYELKFGFYQESGSKGIDYAFFLSDKKLVYNSTKNGYEFEGIYNSKMNAFTVSDLTLTAKDKFVDNFFFDKTESLPGGIDDAGYYAQTAFDALGEPISEPYPYPIKTVNFKILSKTGNNFEIEFDAVFGDGAEIKNGYFKGTLEFI